MKTMTLLFAILFTLIGCEYNPVQPAESNQVTHQYLMSGFWRGNSIVTVYEFSNVSTIRDSLFGQGTVTTPTSGFPHACTIKGVIYEKNVVMTILIEKYSKQYQQIFGTTADNVTSCFTGTFVNDSLITGYMSSSYFGNEMMSFAPKR